MLLIKAFENMFAYQQTSAFFFFNWQSAKWIQKPEKENNVFSVINRALIKHNISQTSENWGKVGTDIRRKPYFHFVS